MAAKEKNRTFEAEALILPALKMVLVEFDQKENSKLTQKKMKLSKKDFTEELVMLLIGKLSLKD